MTCWGGIWRGIVVQTLPAGNCRHFVRSICELTLNQGNLKIYALHWRFRTARQKPQSRSVTPVRLPGEPAFLHVLPLNNSIVKVLGAVLHSWCWKLSAKTPRWYWKERQWGITAVIVHRGFQKEPWSKSATTTHHSVAVTENKCEWIIRQDPHLELPQSWLLMATAVSD